MLPKTDSLPVLLVVLFCSHGLGETGPQASSEIVGQRPYEMEWAGRLQDTRPPNVDFEDTGAWVVECRQAVAEFARSRRQQLWGQYVGSLRYRGEGDQPAVTVRPAQPLPLPQAWDCVNLWVYGNNWAWAPDRSTPPVTIHVLLRTAQGAPLRVNMGTVRWKEWWLMHRRMSPEQMAALSAGGTWEGFEISGGRNREDRWLHFDHLSFYRESLPPLRFEPRPLRGIDPFPGQTQGTNTGPDRLPFPTRQETILPDNLTDRFQVSVREEGDAFLFVYEGGDGRLAYRYQPATGTFSDIEAEWSEGGESVRFRPTDGGGVYFAAQGGGPAVPAQQATLLACHRAGDALQARWKCCWEGGEGEVTYMLRLWQKSLVIDVACPGGVAVEVRFGRAAGLENPRLVTLPYLVGAQQRPAVLVSGPPERPLLATGLVDHTRSNASELWFANQVGAEGTTYNGGSRYVPKTDGRRNDCFERLFLTISPRLEEVLPNIPNPKSPWMHVAGERLWRAHGASDRERDYAHWKRIARYGMTKIVITDHETGWRDGGESFTFRTRAAPGKGGDAGQAEYARKIQALGFRYGIYNNYTDFAPVNEYWDEDLVTRLPDGQWRTAWARCYNPKPAYAVEFEARLAPIIQQKFQLDTAYCDVHTAVRPWDYCDYDARVPGAGTFAATFYAYGEIMLHQKKTWNGPVYSEGNNHWYYCGLTDGNYGQDQVARLSENPWLVDFDLRKMHPLCCNFGMGNPGMFFGREERLGSTPEQQQTRLDQFLAATLAFGHTGFLVTEAGIENTVRSYFAVQQVHSRYAQAIARDIRYADGQGRLLDSTAAVATGAYRRSQVLTRYDNGVEVFVNGHRSENWTLPQAVLPPFGWYAADTASGDLLAYSALLGGHRVDYVDSPSYLYADPRGRFVRFDKLACDGAAIVHRRDGRTMEVIPVGACQRLGVATGGRSATAIGLDEEGKELGAAETRYSRGKVYILPLPGAFSYRLAVGGEPDVALHCPRSEVVPGETVTVVGREGHEFRVPPDAVAGTQLWQQYEGAWIDFLVRPLVDARLELHGRFRLELISHAPAAAEADIEFDGQKRAVRLPQEEPVVMEFPLATPAAETAQELLLDVRIGPLAAQRRWWLQWQKAVRTLAVLNKEAGAGQRLRGGKDTGLVSESGSQVTWAEVSCGGAARRGLFMHPPYRTGVGHIFAVFGPFPLPADMPATFRCRIGKRDESDPGDGILFQVVAIDAQGIETVVAEKPWSQHAWSPLEADLARWSGREVQIKLVADVGPKDNSVGDWACWAEMRIESSVPILTPAVRETP